MKPNLSGVPVRSLAFVRRVLVGGILVTAAGWVGCGGNPTVSQNTNPTGVYQLVSVNGAPVPTKISHDRVQLEVRSGAFTFSPDGKCSSKMVFVPPNGKEATREVKATYSRDGSKLTMRWEGAGMTQGQLQGDNFTMNNEGMVLSYRK